LNTLLLLVAVAAVGSEAVAVAPAVIEPRLVLPLVVELQ
jgi:hypothetical protein